MIDSFKTPKKGGVTRALAQKSLDKAKEEFGEQRYGVIRTDRSEGVINITYGINGRTSLLDADALALELNG